MLKQRRKSTMVSVGNVSIGGGAPVVIQSMTDTDTCNVVKTTEQVAKLIEAGSEIVRITVNNDQAAAAVPEIKKSLQDMGYDQPLVGDFHFIGHRLLKNNKSCREALDKYRINPGNVGRGVKHNVNFDTFIKLAIDNGKPVRIGVNAGSLDVDLLTKKMNLNKQKKVPASAEEVEIEALVDSAMFSADRAIELGLEDNKIIISCKVSDVNKMVTVYRKLAQISNFALHIGLTEAGTGRKGMVATTSALSILLSEGIGDTIRASITPGVLAQRELEVSLCQDILQVLGIRQFNPTVTSCPGCGRTNSAYFRELAERVSNHIEVKKIEWAQRYPGSENLKIAVMGCVVNGPGESRAADIGISLPGSGEGMSAPVYVDGAKKYILKGGDIESDFIETVEEYIKNRWSIRQK